MRFWQRDVLIIFAIAIVVGAIAIVEPYLVITLNGGRGFDNSEAGQEAVVCQQLEEQGVRSPLCP